MTTSGQASDAAGGGFRSFPHGPPHDLRFEAMLWLRKGFGLCWCVDRAPAEPAAGLLLWTFRRGQIMKAGRETPFRGPQPSLRHAPGRRLTRPLFANLEWLQSAGQRPGCRGVPGPLWTACAILMASSSHPRLSFWRELAGRGAQARENQAGIVRHVSQPLDSIAAVLEGTGNYRVLRRLSRWPIIPRPPMSRPSSACRRRGNHRHRLRHRTR